MQQRRLGHSDLVVSEVGFGTWTLVTDWWGRTDDPHDDDQGRARRGHHVLRHRAGVRRRRRGRDDPARLPRRARRARAHHQGRLRHLGRAHGTQGAERPTTGRPHRCAARSTRRSPGSAPTTSTCCSSTTRASSRSSTTRCGTRSSRSAPRARSASSAWRSGPAIGWVEEGNISIDERPITTLQTVFNILEQEPGLTFAARERVRNGDVSLIARVPHASDTLSGKIDLDTVFPPGDHRAHRNRENMLDNFEKAETLGFLWTAETGRTIGQAAIAGILANPRFASVLPTVLSVDEVREYAPGLRPPALGRRGRRARRSARSQLRSRRPLHDGHEIECLTRRTVPRVPHCGCRRTNADNSSSRSRVNGSRSRASTPRRWTRSPRRRASRSPCSTNTSRASVRCTSSCSRRPAGSC